MGKVGVLLNVECEEEKGRRGRRPVRNKNLYKIKVSVQSFWICVGAILVRLRGNKD